MNKSNEKILRHLEITMIPVKQPQKTFNPKGETQSYYDWILKPHYIKAYIDDCNGWDVYKRIKDSCYWRIPGLKGYEFALIVRLNV